MCNVINQVFLGDKIEHHKNSLWQVCMNKIGDDAMISACLSTMIYHLQTAAAEVSPKHHI